MKLATFRRQKGFTLAEMLIGIAVGSICLVMVFSVIWTGTKLVTRNMSVNLSHFGTIQPMQQITDDVHSAVIMPTLTGALTAASNTVPPGFTGGGTKNWSGGTMKNWSFASVTTGATPAAGLSLYLPASTMYARTSTPLASGSTYSASGASFVVSGSTFAANSATISLELKSDAEGTLFRSSTNGMYLYIPSASVNGTSLLRKINSVSVNGSVNANTLLATCTLSSTLGVTVTSGGTRSNNSGVLVQAYLVVPVNYFVCGTDLIRLNYDGNWQVIMRNLVPVPPAVAPALPAPFSVPWPPTVSYLASAPDGRRAVNVSLAASNPDYSNNVNTRGTGSNMLLNNVLIWSRMQKYDAYNGTSTRQAHDELAR